MALGVVGHGAYPRTARRRALRQPSRQVPRRLPRGGVKLVKLWKILGLAGRWAASRPPASSSCAAAGPSARSTRTVSLRDRLHARLAEADSRVA